MGAGVFLVRCDTTQAKKVFVHHLTEGNRRASIGQVQVLNLRADFVEVGNHTYLLVFNHFLPFNFTWAINIALKRMFKRFKSEMVFRVPSKVEMAEILLKGGFL